MAAARDRLQHASLQAGISTSGHQHIRWPGSNGSEATATKARRRQRKAGGFTGRGRASAATVNCHQFFYSVGPV
ncbi:hypothetical protein EJB05_56527 [Eragrostis curvula]|uniref:Uncharacterized protein n=1 Tax=Eragrostis curvula TaxID=38414 RepID=A0A5J9SFY8_9POAL|nr:hypothetical protein EJB05_56527 [Eragrostis curvula]